ncbi:Transposon Ty3-I Gag-Pol polyprotein [Araneus ventricosus]|uniref:RNA-directed DNA polymerase n=1 Tax=Araneus ventricosus TaxID=182803 RepID=A0A4Y2C3M3_ARAVE|nr:Transposon Ty3-I Gag-Pol polyprotein [Araneus ventricosus]
MFSERNPILRTDFGKLVGAIGRCMLRVDLNGVVQPFEFLVFQQCSHDLILGWDFFKATDAIIDCGSGKLQIGEATLNDPYMTEVNYGLYAANDVDVPENCIRKVLALAKHHQTLERVIITGANDFEWDKELKVPASIATIQSGKVDIWIANSSCRPQIIPAGICIARMTEIEEGLISSLNKNTDKVEVKYQAHLGQAEEDFEALLATELDDLQRKELLSLLVEFTDVFDLENKPVKVSSKVKHRINTADSQPVKQKPYRVSFEERRVIQEEVDKMLKLDIIEHSKSPWSSPVVLVKKKNGTWRFCVDYRRLNKITKKDVYPLPRTDDALDSLSGASLFSTMDLKSGYWQIEVDERDREKTAFITPDGLYQFRVIPFGLCNASATFERLMNSLLKGMKWKHCLCYLDDVIVYAAIFEEHLRRLSMVLQCIRSAGLTLNHEKCFFSQSRLKILGHLVDKDGIHPDPGKVEAIQDFPTPKSISQVRSFLGICSYYRRFVHKFADIDRPLHELLKQDVKFEWKDDHQLAFARLKSLLTKDPVLGIFIPGDKPLIHTDASGYGIGAVLVQIQCRLEKPIAYASRSLTLSEKNYSTTEKECLAVIWAISKFRPYIFGRPFTVITDNHSLCWLANLKDPSGRLARWALCLQEYYVDVVFNSGRRQQDADCLSRNPLPEIEEETSEDIPFLNTITNFKEEQSKDPKVADIQEEMGRKRDSTKFKEFNGILYRKNYDPLGKQWLLFIPKHLREGILKSLHDAPTAGHLGFAKTYGRIRRKIFWPGLYRSFRRYVSHCRECQRRKSPPQRPPGLLQPILPAEIPFAKIGIDLLGRFPLTTQGNRWIIVCTDYLTRFTVTKALPSGEAVEIAKFLVEDVILKHGSPREIISDRGRSFLSNLVKENWDNILPFDTFAYNSAKQETTGFSPFFLVHGRDVDTPLDAILPFLPDESAFDYVHNLVTKAEEARQFAKIHLTKVQDKDKSRYDERHRTVSYQEGDLVWIFTPIRKVGLSEKLLKRYFGPYRVTKRLSDVTYEVEPCDSMRIKRRLTDVVHVLRMKPKTAQTFSWRTQPETIHQRNQLLTLTKGPLIKFTWGLSQETAQNKTSGSLCLVRREKCRGLAEDPIAERLRRCFSIPRDSGSSRWTFMFTIIISII